MTDGMKVLDFSDFTLTEWFLNILLVAIGTGTIWAAIRTTKNAWLQKISAIDDLKLVAAGSANEKRNRAKVIVPKAKFVANGEEIDITPYQQLLVDGNSMKNFGINNNDVVLVSSDRTIDESEKNPIIVLKVYPKKNIKIEFKLRRFIEYKYFESIAIFEEWLNSKKNILGYKVCDIRRKSSDEIENTIKQSGSSNSIVISLTMVRRVKTFWKQTPHLSVHLADDVFGTVKYRVPRENINVLQRL